MTFVFNPECRRAFSKKLFIEVNIGASDTTKHVPLCKTYYFFLAVQIFFYIIAIDKERTFCLILK